MQKFAGFNLLELIIALVIVGILTAISLPLYSQYFIHEKRLEAEINLVKLANALEQYYIANNTYQDAALDALGFPEKIADNQYRLVIASTTPSEFLIQAIPENIQAKKDTLCQTLLLHSSGKKEITGTGDLAECWQ